MRLASIFRSFDKISSYHFPSKILLQKMASSDIINGACNCGRIQVSLPRSSLPASVSLCHCLNCRASSGSLFAVNMVTSIKDIQVVGKTKTHDDIAESGNTTHRHFCGDCGSAIMSIVEQHPEKAFLKGGLFAKNGVDLPPPGREQFWRRAEKWENPLQNVVHLE